MAFATQIDPKCFYASDSRVLWAVFAGFTYTNTDGGILYGTIAKSGTTITVSLYKNSFRASTGLVAQGSATLVTDDVTEIELTAQNTSGLTSSIRLDLTANSTGADFKVLATFSFDADLQTEAKTISNLTASNQWEGDGTTNCAFVRAHRDATKWLIESLREQVARRVNVDALDMPDLFQIMSTEPAKKAAVNWALSLIFRNKSNLKAPETQDPDAIAAINYERRAMGFLRETVLYLDVNNDGKADKDSSGRSMAWR